jgi:hypothetical protein
VAILGHFPQSFPQEPQQEAGTMTSELDKYWRGLNRAINELSPLVLRRKDVQNAELFVSINSALTCLAMLVKETTKPLSHLEVIGWANIAKVLEKDKSTVKGKGWREDMREKGVITYRNTGRGKPQPVASYLNLIVYKLSKDEKTKRYWE